MLVLSYLYKLSERQTEGFVGDSLAARYFVGLGVEEAVPDHSTLRVRYGTLGVPDCRPYEFTTCAILLQLCYSLKEFTLRWYRSCWAIALLP